MKNLSNKITGQLGEKIASEYLQKKGYKIIETNFRRGNSELDIIAREKDTTVFVEVKTRTGCGYGTPEESVTAAKIRHLTHSIDYYLSVHHLKAENCRLDTVAVILDSRNTVLNITHFKNITL